MGYYGHQPAAGENNSFKILDDISSYALTFDGTSTRIISAADDTLTFNNHRFVQGQRVTYNNGGGGNIGGLTSGTAYYIIKHDTNIIKLATSASNAANGTAINITSVAGSGTSQTLTIAFDGTNKKFKATYNNGVKANLTRAAQLMISINGVIQQGQTSKSPAVGYAVDSDSTIIFSVAPVATDIFWGNLVASNFASFEVSDNDVDSFTGNGSKVDFSLSKQAVNNQNLLVTIDGVVQYPSDGNISRAYSASGNTITFTAAPGNKTNIQVRHIGFAGGGSGSGSGGVTGFYGRTGNVSLINTDDITVRDITCRYINSSGVVTATTFKGNIEATTGTFSGNLVVGGVLQYEDVVNVDSIGIITARAGLNVSGGTATFAGDVSIADKIIHTGDTNTALRFPSADTITAETGGSERLRITSAGSVGINSTSPDRRFTLNQNATCRMNLKSLANSTAGIEFGDHDDHNAGYIVYDNTDNSFQVGLNGTGEKLRIDSSGNIGVNQTNPSAYGKFVVNGTGNVISLRASSGAASLSFFEGGTGRFYIKTLNGSDGLSFVDGDNSSERLRIASAGQVLIGETATSGMSNNDLGMKNNAAIRFRNAAGNAWINSVGLDNSNNLKLGWGGSVDEIHFGISGIGEQARFNSGGKLLIGTTSNREIAGGHATLQVEKNSSEGISLTRTTNDAGAIFLSLGKVRTGGSNSGRCVADDNIGSISWNPSDGTDLNHAAAEIQAHVASGIGGNDVPGHLIFKTNGGTTTTTERMRITSGGLFHAGNLAVSNSWGVHSITLPGNNDATFSCPATLNIAGATAYNTANMAGGGIRFVGKFNSSDSYTTFAHVAGIKENTTDGDYDGALTFHTRTNGGMGAERLRITSDGELLINSSTTGGANKLQLFGTTDDQVSLRIKRTNGIGNGSLYGGLEFVDNNNVDIAYIKAHNESNTTASYLTLGTYGSGSLSERLRIKSDGKIGINEASPDRDLHVTGGTPYIRVESTGANASATLELYHTRGNGSDKWPSSVSTQDGSITLNTASGQNGTPVERLRCNNNGDIGINCDSPTNISDHRGLTLQGSGGNAAGFINFLDTADNSDARLLASDGQLYIHADPSDNTADSLITFRVDNAEKARLTHDANFRINTMASVDGNTTSGLHVYNSGGSTASFKRAQSGAGLRFIHVNTLSGWIEFNSNNTVSYTSASDYRLKENNVPISDGIARVKNLKPYRFNWKAEPDKTVDGFFAHEAQEVVPESATRSKDRVVTQEDLDTGYVQAPMKVGDPIHQSMDNAKLVPLLTAALKEVITEIETLKTKVAALESS